MTNKLQLELQRLYLLPDQGSSNHDAAQPRLTGADGRSRALVLELARPADWSALSVLWRGVQNDLELPAPAIAVTGKDGYQLWFSLESPVPALQAHAFLSALCTRYLSAVAPARLRLLPTLAVGVTQQSGHAALIPAQIEQTGRWSAYVAPDLAAVFADDPWLDLCPSPDAQADVLLRLRSITPGEFQAALGQLCPVKKTVAPLSTPAPPTRDGENNEQGEPGEPILNANASASASASASANANANLQTSDGQGPRHFLRQLMNDAAADMCLRLDAAKALLPYMEG